MAGKALSEKPGLSDQIWRHQRHISYSDIADAFIKHFKTFGKELDNWGQVYRQDHETKQLALLIRMCELLEDIQTQLPKEPPDDPLMVHRHWLRDGKFSALARLKRHADASRRFRKRFKFVSDNNCVEIKDNRKGHKVISELRLRSDLELFREAYCGIHPWGWNWSYVCNAVEGKTVTLNRVKKLRDFGLLEDWGRISVKRLKEKYADQE